MTKQVRIFDHILCVELAAMRSFSVACALLLSGRSVTVVAFAPRGHHYHHALRTSPPPLRSSGDTVTGTKFEETDEKKNPEKRPGHAVKGMPEVDPETAAKQARIREHQDGCARLSWPEEIRTLMAQPNGFATLSTVHSAKGCEGFPLGSKVGFAVEDGSGLPIFCFSAMSAHTKNLFNDPRCSLCVTEPGFVGAADARTTFVGNMEKMSGDAEAAARETYLKYHPNAYWAQFGDFTMWKLADVKEISFVGGFARAGGITAEEYASAEVDPCAAFAAPVMAHMNDDHASSIMDYLAYIVGVGADTEMEKAEMKRLDRYGFDVRMTQPGGASGVLRVPFPEPVTERKDIKSAIIALSKQCEEIKQSQ